MRKILVIGILLISAYGISRAEVSEGVIIKPIKNQNTLQSGATFYVSSGTVTNLNTTTIKFNDGTTQTTGGITSGSTFYIQNTVTLQSSATFYVSSGTATNLNTSTLKFSDGTTMTTGASGIISLSTGVTGRLPNANGSYFTTFEPEQAKILVPGTTNFPKIDNSTTAATSAQYWDSASTQTVVYSRILRPWGGVALKADFYYSAPTVTSGNANWGTTLSCITPGSATNIENQFNGYVIDQSTAGAVPGTVNTLAKVTATLNMHSCAEGDLMTILVTRNHGVASDAAGDVGTRKVFLRE